MDPVSLRHWLAGCWVGGGGNIAVVAYKGVLHRVLQTIYHGVFIVFLHGFENQGKTYIKLLKHW